MTAFLDIETGGFSIEKNGICEIALVVVDNTFQPLDMFHRLIKPYTRPCGVEMVSYKDDAMAVNGLTIERLMSEGVPVTAVMADLNYFCKKHRIQTIIGHNAPAFDIPRVNYLLGRFASGATLPHRRSECTLKMSRGRWPQLASHKQEDLCKMLGIDNPDSHSAKGDCYANIELYKRLISN